MRRNMIRRILDGSGTRAVLHILAVAGVTLLMMAPAIAQPTWFYIRGDIGGSFAEDPGGNLGDDAGTAALIDVGLGFKVLPFIRTDVTLTYRTGYEIDSDRVVAGVNAQGDVDSWTGMLNAYFDFPEIGRFQPYVGAGVGVSYNDADSVNVGAIRLDGDTSTDFAWQAGFGTGISIVPGVALDLGYRFVDLGEVKTRSVGGVGVSGDLRAHELMAGIRVGF